MRAPARKGSRAPLVTTLAAIVLAALTTGATAPQVDGPGPVKHSAAPVAAKPGATAAPGDVPATVFAGRGAPNAVIPGWKASTEAPVPGAPQPSPPAKPREPLPVPATVPLTRAALTQPSPAEAEAAAPLPAEDALLGIIRWLVTQ